MIQGMVSKRQSGLKRKRKACELRRGMKDGDERRQSTHFVPNKNQANKSTEGDFCVSLKT